ncbi:porin family protein [Flavobacterium daejeonense]|uniref:porin family protein n=1 Tax=Flavobacterium daejeonense TaxID=350893 RepID=UPI000689B16B|nr:porin family protein [Flavobacterium daejeonense]
MKKVILSVIAVLSFAFANAQESKTVRFGVKAGANYDWLATGDASVYDLRPEVGYHAGLVAEFKMCDEFSFQAEALYSHSSFKFDGNGNTSGSDLKISEIAIPVLAKFHLVKGLSIEVGPQASAIIDSEAKGIYANTNLRKYNIASVSGLAYGFNSGAFVQARYVYNFLDLAYGPAGNNRFGIQASVGYKF